MSTSFSPPPEVLYVAETEAALAEATTLLFLYVADDFEHVGATRKEVARQFRFNASNQFLAKRIPESTLPPIEGYFRCFAESATVAEAVDAFPTLLPLADNTVAVIFDKFQFGTKEYKVRVSLKPGCTVDSPGSVFSVEYYRPAF